ncbi:Aste57867_21588 [Aphanomyces stellatus]|uniref:Aste57867_21588 protein n=1 Tax=Aphanomyces stellatus TaxID=120398 RepID=A0A485LJA3_9STRA|nr:hypothetical protein As57867_021519 [Aphanomyces stellatus]VFT98258.1 Aste57867_21588 [Aphanomyces stellatus]
MSRQDELTAFKKLVPASCIETCSPEQLQASIQYTRYRKLRMRLRFPDKYPHEELVIELMSDTLPDIALRRLTKFVDAKAVELAKAGQPQVQPIVELVQASLADNKLLYAFDEIRQLRLLAEQNGGEIKLIERAGRIKLLLRYKNYTFHANMKLDDHYPDSPVAFACDESNFPPSVTDLIVKRANNMIGRIVQVRHHNVAYDPDLQVFQGYTADQALFASNPIKKPLTLIEAIETEIAPPPRKPGTKKAAAAPKIIIKESTRETISPLYYALDGGILHRAPLDVAVKSLIPVVKTFVWEQCLVGLSATTCVACSKSLFPEDPTTKLSPATTPIQAYCEHWYHTECLGQILERPPFVHGCQACQVVLHHPKWSTNVDDMKRKHVRDQQQARELEELADMF